MRPGSAPRLIIVVRKIRIVVKIVAQTVVFIRVFDTEGKAILYSEIASQECFLARI